MKNTRILALILALAMAVCVFAACGTEEKQPAAPVDGAENEVEAESKPIVMGTQIGFPPFEYMDDNGDPAGFDIDLSGMIAEKSGRELQIEDMDFNGLIAALQSGKIDFAAAGMSVTEDRKKNVDFSEPYYNSRQVIVVPIDSEIAAKEDLEGKIVAVQEGTTGESMVNDEANAASVASFKKNADVAMEVLNGRADAFVLDEEPSKAIVAKNADKLKVLDVEFGTEEYAIAVNKGNTELLNIVNATISEMMQDGTYDEMIAKYFPDRAVEADAEVAEEVVADPAE